MVFPVVPFFRSPFTDLTQVTINAQHYDKCGVFELQMMECKFFLSGKSEVVVSYNHVFI